jgi:methionine biosynthesis protein MetW
MTTEKISLDHRVISDLVDDHARILDLGCGSGELMYLLARDKNAKVQGIELDEEAIYRCVEKGLSVFHGDIESGLTEYPDESFDYVILNQSMQQIRKVEFVIHEALRVGNKVIVGFPNFAYIGARMMLFFRGRSPVTPSLPHLWYDTPNVRFLSINDFKAFCDTRYLHILADFYLGDDKTLRFWPNLLASNAIFLLQAKQAGRS